MEAGFLVVYNLTEDFHTALDVCDSGAVSALHCLLVISWELKYTSVDTRATDLKACKQDGTYQENV